MKKKKLLLIVSILVAIALVGTGFYLVENRIADKSGPLELYGNVEIREVNLAFQIPERVKEILVEEGDLVRKGDKLGTLETVRIQNSIRKAEAAVKAQEAVLLKRKNGPRKELIDQARAILEAERAVERFAEIKFQRQNRLYEASAQSQQSKEDAESNYSVATGKTKVARRGLDLLLAGTREEDILEAEATLEARKADLAILKQQLKDTELTAPADGVIRNRILEPGDMASPEKPAFLIAIRDPKWVRAYVSETDLTRLKTGMKAKIYTDSLKTPLDGWVGYISSVAEFTPKTVETKELRTALVYEVRIFVKDPGNLLRLGAPATVIINPQG